MITQELIESIIKENAHKGKLPNGQAIYTQGEGDIKMAAIELVEKLNIGDVMCISFTGTLNEAHYKCHRCGKEEWEHNF